MAPCLEVDGLARLLDGIRHKYLVDALAARCSMVSPSPSAFTLTILVIVRVCAARIEQHLVPPPAPLTT